MVTAQDLQSQVLLWLQAGFLCSLVVLCSTPKSCLKINSLPVFFQLDRILVYLNFLEDKFVLDSFSTLIAFEQQKMSRDNELLIKNNNYYYYHYHNDDDDDDDDDGNDNDNDDTA